MLAVTSLTAYLDAYRTGLTEVFIGPCRPSVISKRRPEASHEVGELRYLARVVRIAAYLDQTPIEAADALDRIRSELRDGAVLDFEDAAWVEACRWAIREVQIQPSYRSFGWLRERAVADACAQLRQDGYKLEVTGLGVEVETRSRAEILRRIDGLVRVIGGRHVLDNVFRIMRESARFHDGFFLFGNFVVNPSEVKSSTFPYGWLISLGLKNLNAPQRTSKPEVAWKKLTDLSTAYAASIDVERYDDLFGGIDAQPADLPYIFRESTGWSQLFTQPQSAARIVSTIRTALAALTTAADKKALGWTFDSWIGELDQVVKSSRAEGSTLIQMKAVERSLPLLAADLSLARQAINQGFSDPAHVGKLNHRSQVLFPYLKDDVLLLPRSLTAASAATMIAHRLWNKLDPNRARQLVGDMFERVVVDACRSKAGVVTPDVSYVFGGKQLQIDVAVSDLPDITLFEVKSKSLTVQALSGDFIKTLDDYAGSFAALALQLARHENAILAKATPLMFDANSDGQITHVALSPLSFGPISDRGLMRPLLNALLSAEITATEGDTTSRQILAKLDKTLKGLLSQLQSVAINEAGQLDLHPLMLRFFWLDIGELLYLLQRASSVTQALRPLRYLTFTSRDFWTEVAMLDLSSIGKDSWAPPKASSTATSL